MLVIARFNISTSPVSRAPGPGFDIGEGWPGLDNFGFEFIFRKGADVVKFSLTTCFPVVRLTWGFYW